MKLIISYLFVVIVWWSGNLWAGEQRQIELNDGSVISGEIISFSNGSYTIKSDSLGTLEIKDTDIQAIRSQAETPLTNPLSPSTNLAIDPNLQSLQSLMMTDPQIMNSILELQDDPQFQSVLQDADVMNAITSGNFNTLLNNPNFRKLLEHQKVKEIAKQVEEKQ